MSKVSTARAAAYTAEDWGLLAATAAIWGASFLFIDIAVDHLAPGLVALLRLAFGSATLMLFPASRRPIPRSDWVSIVALGAFWMALPFFLFAVAERSIASSLAGMLNGAVPLTTAIVAAIVFGRLPSPRQITGLVLGFAGVVVICLPSVMGREATSEGVALVLIAVLSYGVGINIAAPLQRRHGTLPVILRAELVSILLLAPVGILGVRESTFVASSVAGVAALGCLGTALAFIAFTTLIGRVGSTSASVAIYFLPAVAIVLGAVVRHEHIVPTSIVGTLCVLGGAYLVARGTGREQSIGTTTVGRGVGRNAPSRPSARVHRTATNR